MKDKVEVAEEIMDKISEMCEKEDSCMKCPFWKIVKNSHIFCPFDIIPENWEV